VIALLLGGARAVRARLRVVLAVYALQLAVSLIFTAAASLALARVYGDRPLFARGVAGDDAALMLALQAHGDVPRTLFWVGVALLGGWALLSLYLAAGLLGALAGRGFAATAAARFGAFVRLLLWSLIPWLPVAAAAFVGLRAMDFSEGDLVAWDTLVGRPLLFLGPALLLAAIVCLAVDLARADLVLTGGRGAFRALWRGLRRALRPAPLGHYLLYVALWLGVTALYVLATWGRDFSGAGGAWLLFLLRQATALARFLLRATTSAGQLAWLQLDVLEVREVPERAKALRDVVQPEAAQPVQREALDGE
jgi:hypothetical protein